MSLAPLDSCQIPTQTVQPQMQAGGGGGLCACVGAESSPSHARAPGGVARPSRLAGRRAGSPQLPARCGGREDGKRPEHSILGENWGSCRVPFPSPSFPSAEQSVKFPPFSHRDREPRGAAWLPPDPLRSEAGGVAGSTSPLQPERGAVARAGGRKFPRPEWLAEL